MVEKHRDAHTKHQKIHGPHPHTHLQHSLMSREENTLLEVLTKEKESDTHAYTHRSLVGIGAERLQKESVDEKQIKKKIQKQLNTSL